MECIPEIEVSSGWARWANREKKACVMFAQVFPLMLDIVADVEDDRYIGSHTRRLFLTNVWFSHLDNGEGCYGLSHSGPSAKHDVAIFALPGFHAKDGILNVLPDFIGRLQSKQVEVT